MLTRLHHKAEQSPVGGSMEGWGKTYDLMVKVMTFGGESRLRQATLDLVELRPTDRILEVGCGTGSLTLAAKAKAGPHSQVSGLDIATDMVATAQAKARKAGSDIDFQVGRIEAIPYPDAQFDLVLSSLMFHHIPTLEAKRKGLAEILRVLKPGGQLLIVDMQPPQNAHIRGLAAMLVGHGMLAHPVSEFAPLLKEAGFVQIETGPTKSKFIGYLRGKKP